MAYPYYIELQRLSSDMNTGNFGLWYNKFMPLNGFDSCKASDGRGNDKNAVSHYHEKYNKIRKDPVNRLLDRRHLDQADFCSVLSPKYETVIFKAKLKTLLITGIGESHPHEVSMVFDHNMGIPYIPASGIKGIVRFAHTLGLIDHADSSEFVKPGSKGEFIEESNEKTSIPDMFGGDLEIEKDGKKKIEKLRGKVIFLDAYPEKMPDLHVDIMNPHYGKYYSDDKNETPPADYLDPNPLKFLTVSKDTVFIFRALVDKESPQLIDKVRTAFKRALTEEGVGAKTAVGYGIFDISDFEDSKAPPKKGTPKEEEKPLDKFIATIKILRPTDAGPIGSKIDEALIKLETDEEKNQFALAVKEHMGKVFKRSKAKAKLDPFLE